MLRNAARELDRRRWMPPRPLQHALAFNRLLFQSCQRKASAATVQNVASSRSLLDAGLSHDKPSRTASATNNRLQYAAPHGAKRRTRSGGTAPKRPSNTLAPTTQLLEHMSSSQILEKVLSGNPDTHFWKKRIAKFRTVRLPILLLQEIIRQEELQSANPGELLKLVPAVEESATIFGHPSLAGHERKAIDKYVYILRGQDDDERRSRYLENPTSVPLFIFHFLVRPSSSIGDVNTLHKMIEASQAYYDGNKRKATQSCDTGRDMEKALDIDRANFILIMKLLVRHCHRLEPRFVVKLADSATQYIQSMSSSPGDERKKYITQCDLFNRCLQILRPQSHVQVAQRSTPNAYFWEAQRILLSMSASLPKPLLVDRDGFRAIRAVLSGQSKNHTEVHSSARHAPTWPPYLQPGHGMDERTDPEDNWSRAVSAGALMQEAGFAKDETDDAVDILQGVTTDGTPTIQQRGLASNNRKIGSWEASIRATRNAQEAWDRFRNPPQEGMEPRLEQYAAMFEKLVLREVEPDSRILPGDKAVNFPTQNEANLAEFERARLRPPSISELYQHMRLSGVQPAGVCLRVLVANAESLDTAHQYLRDSTEKSRLIQNLMADEPDPGQLRLVPLGLFAAYIQVCLRVEGRRRSHQVTRVIRLIESRLRSEQSRWVPFIWGIVLKELSQHRKALRVSFHQQLNSMLRITETIGKVEGVHLSTFMQFNKGLRKATRRQLSKLFPVDAKDEVIRKNPLVQALYYEGHLTNRNDDHRNCPLDRSKKQGEDDGDTSSFGAEVVHLAEARTRMKNMFWTLAQNEHDAQGHLHGYQINPLEAMNSRKDAVLSDHAHEYMLALGYLGEFEEMGRLLEWLMHQWGQFDVVAALDEMDEVPQYADFFETLCVFRLVAEPMLGPDKVSILLQTMADRRLGWTWPDDEAIKAYAEMHNDESINTLRRVINLAKSGT